MATESQFDLWRKDIGSNLRKAITASAEKNGGEVSGSDRAWIAMNSALLTSNVMIAERLGQAITLLTTSGDDRFAQMFDRIRTGEQILQRIVDSAETSDLDLEDEVMVSITMAEDWLDPESMVNFATPESVENGTDAQTREFSEYADPNEADAAEFEELHDENGESPEEGD